MKIAISEHFTYKKLIRFTLPTIIMMIFTSIYGVTAYGIIMYVGFIFAGVYMGYLVGTAPIISWMNIFASSFFTAFM